MYLRRGQIRWLAVVGLVLLIGLGTAAAWQAKRQRTTTSLGLVLVASGDTAGWITPCGCASNQLGGLLRRGTYLSDPALRQSLVYADVGGALAPGSTSAYHRLLLETILAGEQAMDIAAHNIGGPEAALGAAYLRELAQRAKAPLISANLRDAGGQPVAPGYVLVQRKNVRLALVGVLSPRYATDQSHIGDPQAAVLQAVRELKGRYDALVVLAYMPETELVTLAAALPEADVVLGGPTIQNMAPRTVGPTMAASVTNKGKFLIHLERVAADGTTTWRASSVDMDGGLPDDPAQVRNLERFRAALAQRDFPAGETGLAAALPANLPPTYRLAGSASCRACHAQDATLWYASGHARAWGSLTTRGNHVDPACQVCHTTGYGLPGGFASAKRDLAMANVGCESCHGPSLAHVQDPLNRRVKTPLAPKEQCIRCHDGENSPRFNYDTYWDKIRHGTRLPLP